MCGICGILDRAPGAVVTAADTVDMSDRLVHRGPDGRGFHSDGELALGHRRLSIIDLGGGAQPIANEDGTVVVVFNGEIYNYEALRAELYGRGHRFRTRSDTEVIVHAYEEWGDDCVQRFRGMFAFALRDTRARRLLLVRDRLGIKPLYYFEDGDRLAFASEIKALLPYAGSREIDRESLDLYLSLRFVPGPRTMFSGIRKLQPGHLLVADRDGVRTRQYWDLPAAHESNASDEELRDRLVQLLRDAVRLRMIADVPLGVFLSGGLDSSVIVALMQELSGGDPVNSFSVGYLDGDEVSDERSWARLVADRLGTRHHELALTADDLGDFLERMVWHLDEPLADPTCGPLYFLSCAARERATVVLSGEGADEIFGGYGIYRRLQRLERLRARMPGPVLGLAARTARHAPSERLRDWLGRLDLPLEQLYTGVTRGFRPELKARLMGDTSGDPMRSVHRLLAPHYAATEGASTLERMLYVDTKVWLPDDLLMKADRMSMATSLELRVPFLDHRLVEFARTVPARLKLGPDGGKQLLRDAFRKVLPAGVVERSKKGFPVPVGAWLRGQLGPALDGTLLAAGSAVSEHLDRSVVADLIREHRAGARDRTQELWSLLVFEAWHRTFMASPDRRLATPAPPSFRSANACAAGAGQSPGSRLTCSATRE